MGQPITPPATSEFASAFNAGLPLSRMVPAGGCRFGEAYNHAVSAEEYGEDGEPVHPIPCYTCGKVSRQVCRNCCRNLCTDCIDAGGHHDDDRRCDFIIPGRGDGPEQSQHGEEEGDRCDT